MFEEAVNWLSNYLDTSKSVRSAVHFLKVANDVSEGPEQYRSRIMEVVYHVIIYGSRDNIRVT